MLDYVLASFKQLKINLNNFILLSDMQFFEVFLLINSLCCLYIEFYFTKALIAHRIDGLEIFRKSGSHVICIAHRIDGLEKIDSNLRNKLQYCPSHRWFRNF